MSAYKKLISGFIALGLMASFLVPNQSQAGIIAVGTISADATAAGINNNFTTIVDAINGQIQGSATTGSTTNILADSVGELDMGDEVNPRLRDRELLGVGTDNTTTQTSFVYTGLTPADDTDLSSDISAGTAYINGYRVVKSATSKTYTASMDTYVDLSQTGVYTFSEVAVGATAPSVASNSARLAKVTTDGTEITAVTDLANRRIPGLIIPANYRVGMNVAQASTTTISVSPGSVEINNAIVNKTASTTLTISTAGDWAGGSSLRATNTTGYVIIDASGNIKLTTTAPTYANYGVSLTAGTKRYSTVSGTVYRYLGWFRMNGTGSGNVDAGSVSNLTEFGIRNMVFTRDTALTAFTASIPFDDTIPQIGEGSEWIRLGIVPTNRNNRLVLRACGNFGSSASVNSVVAVFSKDTGTNALGAAANIITANDSTNIEIDHQVLAGGTDYIVFTVRVGTSSGSLYLNGIGSTGARAFGGTSQSWFSITEEPSELNA